MWFCVFIGGDGGEKLSGCRGWGRIDFGVFWDSCVFRFVVSVLEGLSRGLAAFCGFLDGDEL